MPDYASAIIYQVAAIGAADNVIQRYLSV